MAMYLRQMIEFELSVARHKKSFRRFLTKLERNPPRGLDKISSEVDKSIWKEVDCLSCANCCKQMSPTYTNKDINRISEYLQMTPEQFKLKWLTKDKDGDWLNKSTPCQFLDPGNNKCSIYDIRPADCAGFPHLPKKKMVEYMHVHKQNIEMCPATFKMVERIKTLYEQQPI